MKTVLTIAGSDCSGGAGIQADLKTFCAHRLYGMSVITALTAQNTVGVQGTLSVPAGFVADQLDCVFQDIPPDAVKIGMAGGEETILAVGERLAFYGAKNIVVDPVMISTSGHSLLPPSACQTLADTLFPMASLVTPNLSEAQALCGFPVKSPDDMLRAGRELSCRYSCAFLIKGGHLSGEAADLLWAENTPSWFTGRRILTSNTHGTGCTLSSAIACRLALGHSLPESIQLAKDYLTGALADGLNLGSGSGPVNHLYNL
jgi:hydroxymethylpyrimidine/phosphomethylpyrimidine kinase